ncbi:MAG: hypothetical protein JOY77_02170 [Alphaproteobacteria bacterium]|nr:hypothetical protein [Alphaproteobacteria bacterium]
MPQETAKAITGESTLEGEVEIAIAACGGDLRATVRALIVMISHLTEELDRAQRDTSRGYVRKSLFGGAGERARSS